MTTLKTKRTGLITTKIGMTRVFDEHGEHVPVTVLKLDQVQVTGMRSKEKNGYAAVQLGYGKAKVKNVSKAERGVYAAAKVEPKNEIGGIPRQRRCDNGTRRRIEGGSFQAGPICRRDRDHDWQGICRGHEAMEFWGA